MQTASSLINGRQQPEFVFSRTHLGDVEVHIADGVGRKMLLLEFTTVDLG